MMQTLGLSCPSYSTVKKWCANFQRGDLDTQDAARSGRPSTVSISEIVDYIHDLTLDNRRISAKKIAEMLYISRERVRFIILEQLGIQMLSAKWVRNAWMPTRNDIELKLANWFCSGFNNPAIVLWSVSSLSMKSGYTTMSSPGTRARHDRRNSKSRTWQDWSWLRILWGVQGQYF